MTTKNAIEKLSILIAEGHGCYTDDGPISRHPEGWLLADDRDAEAYDHRGDSLEDNEVLQTMVERDIEWDVEATDEINSLVNDLLFGEDEE